MYKKKIKTRSKMHNIKKKIDGIWFDSTGEALRYAKLKLMQKGKVISNLKLQVRYTLSPSIWYDRDTKGYYFEKRPNCISIQREHYYLADFVYIRDSEQIVEDFKGFRTDVYKKKKNLMKKIYGIEILETSYKDVK